MEPNCVLFIPVSSPSGIGEYMRSMIIAKALQSRWPNINIHFVLNQHVSYLKDCPYTVHSCNGSPTKDSKKVNDVINSLKPDLVIFDASGRAKQFKQAKATGAKVAFISQHNKKRNRGLKFNRLLNTDIHWVVQPDYCIKPLNYWQRLKLTIFNKKTPQNIGAVFELSDKKDQISSLEQWDLLASDYFVFNAGSGGHKINGDLAADIYYQAAQQFHKKTKQKCVVIFGSNYPHNLPQHENIICIKNIENNEFISLLANAKGCIVSAGDTLLQCIALQKLCVAAPVSPDQPARLKRCKDEQLVLAAESNVGSLVQQTLLMIGAEQPNTAKRETTKTEMIINNLTQQKTIQALDIIVDDIAELFQSVEQGSIDDDITNTTSVRGK